MITSEKEWEEILIQKKREWETLQTLKSEVLNRIFEISWAGNHKVTLYGKLPKNALSLIPLGWQAISVCPCGNYGHPTEDCLCDHSKIQEWKNSETWGRYMKADLITEWPIRPSSTWKYEEFEKVADRVKKVKEFRRKFPKEITEDGIKFKEKLRKEKILVVDREVNFDLVAATISDLDQKKYASILHLAEAMQYQGREV